MTPSSLITLETLADALESRQVTSVELVSRCLEAIDDESGQGTVAFLKVDRDRARGVAAAMDALRQAGAAPSRWAGIPVSVKDLFDMAGDVTRAGSRVLQDAPPASRDAEAVARLRRAGFVVMGRTNMTEFAYSGLGLNPHYGTPLSPWRHAEQRIAGGSSSGAAASVADGMSYAALGTDTGGSCRIPAAFCGLAGFKPTAGRYSAQGAFPLSTTLDSVGTIARTAACCSVLDTVLCDDATSSPEVQISSLRAIVPTTVVLDDLDPAVARAFTRTLDLLRNAGARITGLPVPPFAEIARLNTKGGFAAAESWALHRARIERAAAEYDPRVLIRMRRGTEQGAADYIDLLAGRAALIAEVTRLFAPFDLMLCPTTPLVPPVLGALASDAEYGRVNLLALRNPSTVNMFDGCALSLPMSVEGEAPTGIMIAGLRGADRAVLAWGQEIERALI